MGEEIHVFARIACVANHFDRLRRPAVVTAEGRPQPRVRVLKQMLFTPLRHRFDPIVLDALPAAAPAYQPGSIVELSSGEHAVVLDWYPEQPCRPTVQVIEVETDHDRKGEVRPASKNVACQQLRYDLRECADLAIVRHEGFDVTHDNFQLPHAGKGSRAAPAEAPPMRDAA